MTASWLGRSKQRLLTTTSQEYLLWGFGLFILGYFLMPKAAGHARLYYVMVLIPLAFNWRLVLSIYRDSNLLKCLLAFCCYLFLSIFWSQTIDPYGASLGAWHVLLTLSFPVAVVLVNQWYPRRFDEIFKYSIVLAAVFAVISMLVIYWDSPFPDTRLWFFGRMDTPTKASSAYAFFVLLACYFSTLNISGRDKIMFAGFGLVIFFALFLSQGRGALVACVAGIGILLSRKYALQLFLLALAVVIFIFLQPSLWNEVVVKRGASLRPEVWTYTIDKVGDAWLFGIGLLSPSDTMAVAGKQTFHYAHAHSQLLATYREGGLVGIALFTLLWLAAVFSAVKLYIKGKTVYLAMLVLGLICLIPYQDSLITRPREHWLYFWLPLALLVAHFYSGQRSLGESLEIAASK